MEQSYVLTVFDKACNFITIFNFYFITIFKFHSKIYTISSRSISKMGKWKLAPVHAYADSVKSVLL